VSFDIIFVVSKGGIKPKRKRNHIRPLTYLLTLPIFLPFKMTKEEEEEPPLATA